MLIETISKTNTTNILNSNKKYSSEQLEKAQLFYTDYSMVGLYLAVFFKKGLSTHLKQKSLAPCKVKVGARGTAGNKGAVCIRFKIADQSFMVINSHLASGLKKDSDRIG